MFEKNLTHEEWLLAKENNGAFSVFPMEVIHLLKQHFSYYDLSQLQLTNVFWFKEVSSDLQEKANQWNIEGTDEYIIFISGKGHAFTIEFRRYCAPNFISIPSKLPICAATTNGSNNFYLDERKNWFVEHYNTCGQLAKSEPKNGYIVPFLPFDDKSSHLSEIIAVKCVSFLHDDKKQWFGCGLTDSRLGLGKIEQKYIDTPQPLTLPSKTNIVKIKANSHCTFFMDDIGGWHGCGFNWEGMLNQPVQIDEHAFFTPFPIDLPNNKAVKDIVAGYKTTFFLDTDGDWFGCGNSESGVFGIDNLPRVVQPPVKISLPNNKKIIELISKSHNTFFRDEDNHWFACGSNNYGQSGTGDKKPCRVPKPIVFPDNTVISKVVSIHELTYFQTDKKQWFGCGRGNKQKHGFSQSATPVLVDFSIFKKPNSINQLGKSHKKMGLG